MCLTSAWLKTVLLCVGASQLSALLALAGLAGLAGPAGGLLLAVGVSPLPAPAETAKQQAAKQQAARASSWSAIAAAAGPPRPALDRWAPA